MEDIYYYKDGTTSNDLDTDKVLHRVDGPAAIEAGFAECWFLDGVRHREGGPAVIYQDGTTEWWTQGTRIPAPPQS